MVSAILNSQFYLQQTYNILGLFFIVDILGHFNGFFVSEKDNETIALFIADYKF